MRVFCAPRLRENHYRPPMESDEMCAAAAITTINGSKMDNMDETSSADTIGSATTSSNIHAGMCRVCGNREDTAKCLFDTANGELVERLQVAFSCIVSSIKHHKFDRLLMTLSFRFFFLFTDNSG